MGVLAHPLFRQVKKAMILEEETYARFGYYPRDLKPKSSKKILAACDDCGRIRETSKHCYHPFCDSCGRKGARSSLFGKHFSEETKAKMSKAQRGENHSQFGKHPSEVTRGKLREATKGPKNPNWRGGPVERVCEECGGTFYVKPCRIKRDGARFCGLSCARKANIRKRTFPQHHTKPERIFAELCKKNNLSFRYVGDGQLWIGKRGEKLLNPDFIEANGKKIIVEILGDYWHSPLLKWNMPEHGNLNYRERHFKRFKWHPVFIWETDLLRPDAEAYVLNLLRKVDAI